MSEFNISKERNKLKKEVKKNEKPLQSCTFVSDSSGTNQAKSKISLGSSFKSVKPSSMSQDELNKDDAYAKYEIEYSTYLLRKLQKQVLQTNNKNKESKFEKCLVSLKLEYEDLLKKREELIKEKLYIEMYMETIKGCNSRITVGEKALEMFKTNKLDTLFESATKVLEKISNQMQLINISKTEIEKFLSPETIGENSKLILCLKDIQNHSCKNKNIVEKIAAEILEIKELLKQNLLLKDRCQDIFNSETAKITNSKYDALTNIMKTVYERKLKNFETDKLKDSSLENEILKIGELECASNLTLFESLENNLNFSKGDSICNTQPIGASTPHY